MTSSEMTHNNQNFALYSSSGRMEEYIDSDRKIATAIGEKDIRTTMIKNR